MVGSLGTRANAAVGATSTVNWLIGSTVSAIGVGFLALISQAIGAGNRGRAKKSSAQAVMVTAVAGLLLTGITQGLGGVIPKGKTGGRYSREEAEDVSFDHYR